MTWHKAYTIEELPQVVAELRAWGSGISRWLLYGSLGAGKTTLIRQWIGAEVQSPTFTYINVYDNDTYHIDLYRFRAHDYARWEAVYEILETGKLVFVEWAEKLPWPVPLPYVALRLEVTGPTTRHLWAEQVAACYQSDARPPHKQP